MHIRCPHCRNAIEIVADAELGALTCPSCGSGFNLVPDTLAYSPVAAQSVPAMGAVRTIAQFELLAQLGSGSFGTVWKARDTRLDRLVALKVPRQDLLGSWDADGFLREARAAAQLRHPHIVPVHEIGRENGTLYIVSEFVPGQTLAERLAHGPLAAEQTARLCQQIAAALHHAHEAGVIHRDLKPANIMLDQRGEPHLMDFGLAKREAGEITVTVSGKVLGTPAYMSPEQARGDAHHVDRRTDIFSLGVILFEMLTGERPFRGDVRMLLAQVIHDEPPSPRRLNSRIPRDLETICLKCLEKKPAERYATAAEVGDELQRFVDRRPILARPLGRLQRAWRWAARNPTVTILTAAVVMTLLAGSGFSSYFAVQESHRARAEKLQRKRADDESKLSQTAAALAKTESKRAFRNYYISQLNLAERDWEANDIINLRRRLARTLPQFTGGDDLRGFEWRYWERMAHRELMTLEGHASSVRCLAISPDGTRIVSGSLDNTLRVWDAATGRELHHLKGHPKGVQTVAFNSQGTKVVSGGYDNLLKVWDVASGSELQTFSGHTAPIQFVAVGRDGTKVISGSIVEAKLWDIETGVEVFALPGLQGAANMAIASGGDRIAMAKEDGSLKVWSAPTRDVLNMQGHAGAVRCLAFSRDGTRLASAGYDGSIKVWDTATGDHQQLLGKYGMGISSLAFHASGKWVVTGGGDGVVRVWDVSLGQELTALKGHQGITGSATGGGVDCVAFIGDSDRIVSGGGDNVLKIWEPRIGRDAIVTSDQAVWSVAFHPDGKQFVSGSNNFLVQLWDVNTGQRARQFDYPSGPDMVFRPDAIRDVNFNRDGTSLAAASSDKSFRVWNTQTGMSSLVIQYPGDVPATRAAWHPDGRQLLTNVAQLTAWDAVSGERLFTRPASQPEKGSFLGMNSSASRYVAGGIGNDATVCDLATGRAIAALRGHAGSISAVAFHPTLPQVVTGAWDNNAKLWNATTGRELLNLAGHQGVINDVLFSPDGQRIITASWDSTIKIWDTITGQELLTLKGHATSVSCLAMDPAGTCLVSGCLDGVVRIWQTAPP